MRARSQIRCRKTSAGNSLIELALVLPLLLLLMAGVIDFGRAIHFNNILINMSREGANLAARTTASPQYIIDALNHTAVPVNMELDGMVYITTVVGLADGSGVVQEQYRATNGNASLGSKVYGCPSWGSGGKCNVPSPGPVITLSLPLTNGETVRVVETSYLYTPIVGYVMQTSSVLYSQTLL